MKLAAVVLVLATAVPASAGGSPTAYGETRRVIVHDHASQRYDRSLDLLRAEFRRHTRRPVDLVTWTEVEGPARSRPLRQRGDGWVTRIDPRTDVAISWRARRFELRASSVRILTGRTYRTRAGFERRTRMIAAVLDDRDVRRRVLVTVAHLPAVDPTRVDLPRRRAAWRTAVEGWADDVRTLRRRWDPDLVVTVADWNVNLRRPVWRTYLRARFEGQRITWARPLPRSGTHGSSLIDATLTDARGRARLLPDTAASDHRAYRERLR